MATNLVAMAAAKSRMSAHDRRVSIVDAAVVEFAHGGFAGTSTEDIARRAGISQPYLFRLFPTKKDLFLATVERCWHRIGEAFAEAAEGLEGEEALGAMGMAYGAVLGDRDLLLLQLHMYAACADPDVRDAVRVGYGELWSQVERLCGQPVQDRVAFFASGMLCNVVAAMDLQGLDQPWAQALARMHEGPPAAVGARQPGRIFFELRTE